MIESMYELYKRAMDNIDTLYDKHDHLLRPSAIRMGIYTLEGCDKLLPADNIYFLIIAWIYAYAGRPGKQSTMDRLEKVDMEKALCASGIVLAEPYATELSVVYKTLDRGGLVNRSEASEPGKWLRDIDRLFLSGLESINLYKEHLAADIGAKAAADYVDRYVISAYWRLSDDLTTAIVDPITYSVLRAYNEHLADALPNYMTKHGLVKDLPCDIVRETIRRH